METNFSFQVSFRTSQQNATVQTVDVRPIARAITLCDTEDKDGDQITVPCSRRMFAREVCVVIGRDGFVNTTNPGPGCDAFVSGQQNSKVVATDGWDPAGDYEFLFTILDNSGMAEFDTSKIRFVLRSVDDPYVQFAHITDGRMVLKDDDALLFITLGGFVVGVALFLGVCLLFSSESRSEISEYFNKKPTRA